MKANELRIGNFVYLKSKEKVYQIDSGHDIEEIDDAPEMFDAKPIELTEEWLLKFGFKKGDKSRYGNKFTIGVADWGFTIENSFEKGKWFFGHEYYDSNNEAENYQSMHFCYDLKFVHQLQNIYFSLTFNELECEGF